MLLLGAIQAIAAFIQLPDALKTPIFFVIFAVTMGYALWKYPPGSIPVSFVAIMVLSIGVFLLSSGAVRNLLNQPKSAPPLPTFDAPRFVRISTFLDENGDGIRQAGEEALPNVPIRIIDANTSSTLRNETGQINAVGITTSGLVTVEVCGISQQHEISSDHTSKDPLDLSIGLTQAQRQSCTETNK